MNFVTASIIFDLPAIWFYFSLYHITSRNVKCAFQQAFSTIFSMKRNHRNSNSSVTPEEKVKIENSIK